MRVGTGKFALVRILGLLQNFSEGVTAQTIKEFLLFPHFGSLRPLPSPIPVLAGNSFSLSPGMSPWRSNAPKNPPNPPNFISGPIDEWFGKIKLGTNSWSIPPFPVNSQIEVPPHETSFVPGPRFFNFRAGAALGPSRQPPPFSWALQSFPSFFLAIFSVN